MSRSFPLCHFYWHNDDLIWRQRTSSKTIALYKWMYIPIINIWMVAIYSVVISIHLSTDSPTYLPTHSPIHQKGLYTHQHTLYYRLNDPPTHKPCHKRTHPPTNPFIQTPKPHPSMFRSTSINRIHQQSIHVSAVFLYYDLAFVFFLPWFSGVFVKVET